MKAIEFLGDSLERLRGFPPSVRRQAGFELDRIQRGIDPFDWKPLSTVGLGVRELRVRDESGAYRVLYVATFEDALFVLHCFKKKTRVTPRHALEVATKRYRTLVSHRNKEQS